MKREEHQDLTTKAESAHALLQEEYFVDGGGKLVRTKTDGTVEAASVMSLLGVHHEARKLIKELVVIIGAIQMRAAPKKDES